jgi:hypothetical protein
VSDNIGNISIRNTMIIGLTNYGQSVECWRYDISKDATSSISHLKSIHIGDKARTIFRIFGPELSVSCDPELYILSTSGLFLSKDKELHDIFPGENLEVDKNAQFLATWQRTEDVALIIIFDVLTLREVNRVKVIVHPDLGGFLGYQLLFGLILGYFSGGIMRIGLAGKKFDLVQEINWENSGSIQCRAMS